MKTFFRSSLLVYTLVFFSLLASANNGLYATYTTQAQRPNLASVKIDWSKAGNKKAAQYKSTFESALVQAKAGQKQLLGQRYVMINPGCGSECQVIGYFDTYTGMAYLADVTSSYEIEYRANSILLVVNPAEAIEASYGNQGHPGWLKTEYYVIQPDGQLKQIAQ